MWYDCVAVKASNSGCPVSLYTLARFTQSQIIAMNALIEEGNLCEDEFFHV